MTPTLQARRRLAQKAGFTLLEILLTLAIMGGMAAIMIPRIAAVLSSNADQREAFHFQRLMLDLRANAYHRERDLILVDTGQLPQVDPDSDPLPAELALDEGWSYSLSAPLTISARGLCDPVTAEVAFQGRPRFRMQGNTGCGFIFERTG